MQPTWTEYNEQVAKAKTILQGKLGEIYHKQKESLLRPEVTTSGTAPIPVTEKRYRMLRFIEYTGSLQWLNDCKERRGIKGTKDYAGNGQNVIREGFLGDAAELLANPKLDVTGLRDSLTRLGLLASDLELGDVISAADAGVRVRKIAAAFKEQINSMEKA